jgi:hypothetical protein
VAVAPAAPESAKIRQIVSAARASGNQRPVDTALGGLLHYLIGTGG